jgi:hypothetical protein
MLLVLALLLSNQQKVAAGLLKLFAGGEIVVQRLVAEVRCLQRAERRRCRAD